MNALKLGLNLSCYLYRLNETVEQCVAVFLTAFTYIAQNQKSKIAAKHDLNLIMRIITCL